MPKRKTDDLGLDSIAADIAAEVDKALNPTLLDGIEYKDLEQYSAEVVSATQQAFRDRTKREAQRFEDATDSEYWCALCFRTRADKESFLRQFNISDLGDKYLDGHAVSARLLGRRAPASRG